MARSKNLFARRRDRVRVKLRKVKQEGSLRLSVYRSHQNIYAQLIDDQKGATLVAASTLDKNLRATLKGGGNITAAAQVGRMIAERALAKGIKEVVFDRGGYLFHGRVAALAQAAREAGLDF